MEHKIPMQCDRGTHTKATCAQEEQLCATPPVEEQIDACYIDALEYVVKRGAASISLLQRGCQMGYNRAGKVIEWMEERGYIAPFKGEKTREVFATEEDVARLREEVKQQANKPKQKKEAPIKAAPVAVLPEKKEEGNAGELFVRALKLVVEKNSASISMLQRKLSIGYHRAGEILEWMEKKGYVSAYCGAKPREVLITKEEFEKLYGDFI